MAFLIAGPGTNAATISTIWKLMGRRTALLYLLTITLSAVVGGLTLDWLMPVLGDTVSCAGEHSHEMMGGGWTGSFWAIVLLAVLGYSYAAKPGAESEMLEVGNHENDTLVRDERLEFTIIGMKCKHCSDAVRDALLECPGVKSAKIDLASGLAQIAGEHLHAEDLVVAVKSAGYEAKIVV